MKKQVIASVDPLKSFKEDAFVRYVTCSFFEHDVNQTIDIGVGEYSGNFVKERIITDGKIALQRRNPYSPKVIWQNALVTLENGLSICIEISEATFMVDVIRFGEKTENEIHIAKDNQDSLQRILNFLYHERPIGDLHTISFKSPSILLLESTVNGIKSQEILDFSTGYSKVKKGRK